MNLLFITRKYPPSVGGMQRLSFELSHQFAKRTPTTVIAWGGSQKLLPYFLPYAFLKAAYLIPRKRIEHVHLGDGLLAPMGPLLKLLFRKTATVTACGLDITYPLKPYQMIVPRCLARLDRILCISDATMEECVKRGVPAEKCEVIPIGVHAEDFQVEAGRSDIERLLGRGLGDRRVIVTAGRLVRRKGVAWFVEHVVPRLGPDVLYLVIGEGPERGTIEGLVESLGLRDRVFLLGAVPDRDLKVVYNAADVFVMPNIPIEGDMEGFGIVAIEASSAGLPVVASGLEGITGAVLNGRTGHLVEPGAVDQFLSGIERCLQTGPAERLSIRQATAHNYDWEVIGARYMAELTAVHSSMDANS